MSFRNRKPGRTLFPASDSGAPAAPSVPSSPERHAPVPLEDNVKPEVEVGDYVYIHGRNIGGFHVACRIVGGWPVAAIQLERCSEHNILYQFTPFTSCSPIPLDEWRQAPKVSPRSVTNDPGLREPCSCHITESLKSIAVSSGSEGEKEAPEMSVSNGAYVLSCHHRELVLSQRG